VNLPNRKLRAQAGCENGQSFEIYVINQKAGIFLLFYVLYNAHISFNLRKNNIEYPKFQNQGESA
jgi:hypothetical protein